MVAEHHIARWAKMAGRIILLLLLAPLGGLAMYWAVSQGLVPGLILPDSMSKPAVLLEKIPVLPRVAASTEALLKNLQTAVLDRVHRQEAPRPIVIEVPSFEVLPTISLVPETKNATVSTPTVATNNATPTQPEKTKKNSKQKKSQTKETPTGKSQVAAKTASASPQPAQADRPAETAVAASAIPAVQTAANATKASPTVASASPRPAPKVLAAPPQTGQSQPEADSASEREKRYAVGPARNPAQAEAVKSEPAGRANAVTLASMIAHATNPLATGTALAATESAARNASQPDSGDNLPLQPAPIPDQPAFPASFPQGSLGQMAALRAELEQLKLQVHIEEVRQRLNQLKGQPATVNPAPSLDFPPIGLPGPASEPGAGAQRNPLRLLSIQSLNGKYTATVGTPSGPRVVKVNDTVDGHRVVSISRNSVVINRGKGNEMLSIYE